MNREYHRWYSPNLNRDMELLVFGHAGAKVLVFPTSMGKFYEWEDRGMINTLSEHLHKGWLQLYCVDSVDAESWYAKWAQPSGRAWRHVQYENYLLHELIPLMNHKNRTPFLITTGASFGAFHAMNFGLRHPDITSRILAMSGIYDVSRWLDGYQEGHGYFNNPVAYIKNEHDGHRLNQMRNMDIIITVGEQDSNIGGNRHFSQLLWEKNIWHAFRVWDGWAHDWPYWQKMVLTYIGGHD